MTLINEILQTVLSVVPTGCIYSVIAPGFVMIFTATEVISFAQGEFMMIGAFVAFTLVTFLYLSCRSAFKKTNHQGAFDVILTLVRNNKFVKFYDISRKLSGSYTRQTLGIGLSLLILPMLPAPPLNEGRERLPLHKWGVQFIRVRKICNIS